MAIHIFGSSTSTGKELCRLLKLNQDSEDLFEYSRTNNNKTFIDFNKKETYNNLSFSEDSIVFSFVPIWLFASFINNLDKYYPNKLKKLSILVACSSSSAITKRYSFNRFDKELVSKLISSEALISSICQKYNIKYKILRPSLIYGKIGSLKDQNVEKIKQIIRILPFIILPRTTGLRQPIHSSQLAEVTYIFSQELMSSKASETNSNIIAVGGDSEISYEKMIHLIQESLSANDFGRFLFIFKVPNKIFIILIYPFTLFSIKYFEALLRLFVNLSGFKRSFEITGKKPQEFPIINNETIF